jgi:nucleoside-diphosphate-sugar epimerase
LRLLRARMLVVPGGRGLVTPVYVDDLGDCLVRTLVELAAPGRAFTAWDGDRVSARDFFGYYARMLGRRRVPSTPLPLLEAYAALAELTARVRGRPPAVTRAALRYLAHQLLHGAGPVGAPLGAACRPRGGMRRTEAWLRTSGLV